MVLLNTGVICMIVQEPSIVQDLFIQQNQHYEKTALNAVVYQDLMRETFTFAKSDESWRKKHNVVQ